MKGHVLFVVFVSFVFAIAPFGVTQANVSDSVPSIDKMERAVGLEPLPQTTEAERAQYFPTPDNMNIMQVRLQSSTIISGEGTHTPHTDASGRCSLRTRDRCVFRSASRC